MGRKVGADNILSQALLHNGNKLGVHSSERNQLVTICRFVPLGFVRRDTQRFRQPCVPLRDGTLVGTCKDLATLATSWIRELAATLDGLTNSPARTGNDYRCCAGFVLLARAWGVA